MKYLLLSFALLCSVYLHAQYPTAGTKQRLGYQTTGDGLVFRGSGSPAYTPTGLNNAWVYMDTVTRNLYTYVGGSWQLVSGGGSAFDGHVDSLVFNTNVTVIDSTAKMHWDSDSETITVGINGGASYQMGEELYYPLVINKSGATILNGQLVMVDTATLVTGDHVRIILARNGATYPSNYVMGVATTDIPNDSTGLVTWFGYVREVNHADIAQTGVTLVPGNILYPSATQPGRYTNVAPTTPAHKSTIALVVRKPSDNNMTLLVRPWLAPKLADLSDVNTASVTGLSVLRYNSTSGAWDASATPGIVAADTASMLLPYLRKVDTLSLSNRINLKLNIADTTAMLAPYARGNSTAGRVAYWSGTRDLTGSANLTWTEVNKTLGINTTTTSGANLIIKNSQEPTRATVVTTQTFGADTTNWTRGTGWTFNGTQAVATAATGALTYTPALTITSGNGYEVTFTVGGYSAGTATIALGNASYTVSQINQTNNVILLKPTSATGGFRITTSTFTGNLDNISIVEITNPLPILQAYQLSSSNSFQNDLRIGFASFFQGGGGAFATAPIPKFSQGLESALNVTTGSNFFAQGYRAGFSNTVGTGWIAQGYEAGFTNTIGSNWLAKGYRAGAENVVGNEWIAMGSYAGAKNLNGEQWVAIGSYSAANNLSGSQFVSIGRSSATNNISGSNFVSIGNSVNYSGTTSSNFVAIGESSSYDNNGSNFVSIGNLSARYTLGSNYIAIGGNAARAYSNGNQFAGDFTNSVYIGASTRVGGTTGQRTNENVFGYAAIGNGDNTVTLGNSSILKHYFSGTRQINLPSGNTANRGTGAAGDLRYNTDSTKLEFHNGTAWNGLQSTITNPVTGTGTSGQVAYWSGTGTQTGSSGLRYINTSATSNRLRLYPESFISGSSSVLEITDVFTIVNTFGLSTIMNFANGLTNNFGASRTADFSYNDIVGLRLNPQTGRLGIFRSPLYSIDINATDAIRIPVGTTAQQPTGAAGIVRYNSTNTALEYHNGTAWKTVANTDNTVQTFNFSLNIYNASDSVKNITSPANFFLVPANLNGYCIDSYQVKALSGTGTADVQLAKNGSGANTQAISGTTTYNKDTNITLATGDVIQGQVFNLSAGATLIGLGFTIEIKATCN